VKNILQKFLFLSLTALTLAGCGLISDQPPEGPPPSTTQGPSLSASVSKDVGLQCFGEGDLGCAQKNYCALQGEQGAGLRCCLAGFLQTYFSDNTKALGGMLGYTPLGFAEIKGMSRQELIDKKALPFAELFLLPSAEAPKFKDLAMGWAAALAEQQVSGADLNQKLGELGQGLEASMTCLEGVMGQVKSDKVEKDVFNSDEDIQIAHRDLQFIRFSLGASAYLLQFASQYQWGFDKFPALPLSEDALKDINGETSPSDGRWGELVEGGELAIVGNFGVLTQSLSALKSFSDLKDQPSSIDDYLNWRLSAETQTYASGILKAANDSLKSSDYLDLPDEDYQIRLPALGVPNLIPDSRKVSDATPVLKKNAEGDIEGNQLFFEAWAWSVVRPDPIPAAQP